jgi:hypothetical protein
MKFTRRDKEILRNKGIQWKEGPWTEDEVEILDDNIKNYCLSRGHEDPSKVIFSLSKEDRKDFYPIIARGIRRPVFAVYRRVQRDYDPNNHKGVYSATELAQLNQVSSTIRRMIDGSNNVCNGCLQIGWGGAIRIKRGYSDQTL